MNTSSQIRSLVGWMVVIFIMLEKLHELFGLFSAKILFVLGKSKSDGCYSTRFQGARHGPEKVIFNAIIETNICLDWNLHISFLDTFLHGVIRTHSRIFRTSFLKSIFPSPSHVPLNLSLWIVLTNVVCKLFGIGIRSVTNFGIVVGRPRRLFVQYNDIPRLTLATIPDLIHCRRSFF